MDVSPHKMERFRLSLRQWFYYKLILNRVHTTLRRQSPDSKEYHMPLSSKELYLFHVSDPVIKSRIIKLLKKLGWSDIFTHLFCEECYRLDENALPEGRFLRRLTNSRMPGTNRLQYRNCGLLLQR